MNFSLTERKQMSIPELDTIIDEVSKPKLVVLASRPAIGKTWFLLTMLRRIAVEENIPAGFISLEMSGASILLRLISLETMIPTELIKKKQISAEESIKMKEAAEKLSKAPIHVIDTPSMTIADIKDWIKHIVISQSAKIVFIDYLGLIQSSKNLLNKQKRQTEIVSILKSMVEEFGISIIVSEQINRNLDNHQSQQYLKTFSDSADLVLLLDRESNEPVTNIIRVK